MFGLQLWNLAALLYLVALPVRLVLNKLTDSVRFLIQSVNLLDLNKFVCVRSIHLAQASLPGTKSIFFPWVYKDNWMIIKLKRFLEFHWSIKMIVAFHYFSGGFSSKPKASLRVSGFSCNETTRPCFLFQLFTMLRPVYPVDLPTMNLESRMAREWHARKHTQQVEFTSAAEKNMRNI